MAIDRSDELEIDLSEIFSAIYKNKGLIFLFVIIGIVIASVYLYKARKVYEVSSVILPPRNEDNKAIVGPQEIANLVNRGVLIPKLVDKLNLPPSKNKEYALKFKKAIRVESDKGRYVYLTYETSDTAMGKKVLSVIIELLRDQYLFYVNPIRKDIEASIAKARSEVSLIKNEQGKLELTIGKLKRKLRQTEVVYDSKLKILEDQKRFIKKQLDRLAQRQAKLIAYKKEVQSYFSGLPIIAKKDRKVAQTQPVSGPHMKIYDLAWLIMTLDKGQVYDNLLKCILDIDNTRRAIIEANKSLNDIEEQIVQLKAKRDIELASIKAEIEKAVIVKDRDLSAKLKSKEAEIEQLNSRLSVVKSVQVVFPPSYIDVPIKPKKKFVLAVAFMISVIVGIMVALVRERRANLKS